MVSYDTVFFVVLQSFKLRTATALYLDQGVHFVMHLFFPTERRLWYHL